MTIACDAGTAAFTSGFAGSGWKLDNNAGSTYDLTVDNLVVRRALTAYELDINKINSVNGGIMVSVANGEAYCINGTNIYFDEDGTNKQIQFQVGDWVRAQNWTGRGICSYYGRVIGVTHSATLGSAYIGTTTVSGTPWAKMELVQVGSCCDTDRQNLIYITASDSCNPYIDMLAGVTGSTFAGKTKVRLGNLSGITDTDLGTLNGYGLYADNVFLKGCIIATSGEFQSNCADYDGKCSSIKISGADMWEDNYDGHASILWINRIGYSGGCSMYRNTAIGDGKGSSIAIFNYDQNNFWSCTRLNCGALIGRNCVNGNAAEMYGNSFVTCGNFTTYTNAGTGGCATICYNLYVCCCTVTPVIKITTGAAAGCILTSSADGTASWGSPSAPASHTHGCITNGGCIGTLTQHFLVTTTNGCITTSNYIGNISTSGNIGTAGGCLLCTGTAGLISTVTPSSVTVGTATNATNSTCLNGQLASYYSVSTHAHTFTSLTDTPASHTAGCTLVSNGSALVWATPASNYITCPSSPGTGCVLCYNGSAWIAGTASSSGGGSWSDIPAYGIIKAATACKVQVGNMAAGSQTETLFVCGDAKTTGYVCAGTCAISPIVCATSCVKTNDIVASSGLAITANAGNNIILRNGTEYFIWGVANSCVGLYYDNAAKIHTLTNGVCITGCGFATDFIGSSDCRLKTDITPIYSSLSKIDRLCGVQYKLCADDCGVCRIGLIAQDVQKVVPEVVCTGDDGMYGITYDKLVPMLVEAIKELKRELELFKYGI
jgi:hypothetical protein